MDPVIRRRLAKAPVLLTAYLVCMNRGRRRGRAGLSAAFALFIAWIGAAWLYVHAQRATVITGLAWLTQHDLFLATIFGIVAAVLVARRRALNQIAASRSWTAALPVDRSPGRLQAIVVDSAPALVLACVLAVMFGSLSLIALADAGMRAPVIMWAATTGGVVLGAGLSFLLPAARQEEMYEGSRYVPHRRQVQTPIPTGSLAALGSWPVRQMFASARPKTISRLMIPILLSVPMGSTAADTMVAIGLLTTIGALILLVAATISVSAKASRWLKPLPLGSGLLVRSTLTPAMAFMFFTTSFESWLIWVLGSPVARCITTGVVTLGAGMIFTVAGSLFAIYATHRGTGDRV